MFSFNESMRAGLSGAKGGLLLDGLCIAVLLIAINLHALSKVDFYAPPMEDPAMLMRYATNLAEGHGIVWNVGEAPVDGATDFLLMVVTAGLCKLGAPAHLAVRLISLFAHLLTVALVYIMMVRLLAVGRFVAMVSALYLAFGPAFYYISVAYGVPLFALAGLVAWYFVLKLNRESASWGLAMAFAISALATGLARPEGVFLAGLMLVALVYGNGLKGSKPAIVCFLAVFLVLGGAFLLWRWDYFGYPLPNPFYKKSEGTLHIDSLRLSFRNILLFAAPFAWAYLMGLRSASGTRTALFYLTPVVGFCLVWVLIDSEMNHVGRYQYPALPIALVGWPVVLREALKPLVPEESRDLDWRSRAILMLVCAFIFWQALFLNDKTLKPRSYPDGRVDVARILSQYKDKNYSLVVTEAGILPLYSGWRTMDAWGLNDSWITHNGVLTEDYLDRFRPSVIMFRANFSPLTPEDGKGSWHDMVKTLKNYAEKKGYCLAAAFGPSVDGAHYYYVAPDFPAGPEIVEKIRNIRDYRWFHRGERCVNFVKGNPCK